MGRTLRVLRTVQIAMLGSVLLYIAVGELARPALRAANQGVSYVFSTLSVAVVGMILVVRRTLVIRSAASLANSPEDSLTLSHWRTGYIVTYVLCDALPLFGVALRFLGCSLQQSLPFYLGGFVLIAFFRPRVPVKLSGS